MDETRSEIPKNIPYGFYITGVAGSHGETNGFTINFLDTTREDLARTFSPSLEPEGETVGEATGAPLFEDALAQLECRVAGKLEAGDHTAFLGEAVGSHLSRPADILTDLEAPIAYGG